MPPISKKPYKHANQNKKSRLRSSSTTSSYQSSCTETQCQTCFQWFTNLNSHLSSSNNSCASLPNNRLSNDPSLVTDIRRVNRLSKKKIITTIKISLSKTLLYINLIYFNLMIMIKIYFKSMLKTMTTSNTTMMILNF